MEQSVAKPKRFKKPATFLVVLLALWLLPSLVLLNLSRSYTNSLAQIEELGIRVNELRQSLYFSEPLRVSRINDLALDAQLVYSIRLQIESDFQHALFRPDVNQLLYVADQFLEKFDEFIPIESQVQDIVDNIKMLRADKELSPKLKPLLNEFGVVVFEAMYSDSQSSSATYRAFDSILEKSYSLKTEEQDALQQLLADASALLSDYAQLNYLVDKIKKNSVNEQIIKLEAEFHERQFNLLLVMLGLGLVAMSTLVVWGLSVRKAAQQPKGELGVAPEPNKEKVVQFSDKENELFSESSVDFSSSVTKQSESEPEVSEAVLNQQPEYQPHMGSISQSNTVEAPLAERHIASVTDSKPAIDIEEMLETLDGDAESVELLLGVFVQDHAGDYEKFKSLLTKDETSAARIVHSLKGVAGSIKASRLAIIAASIEMTMKQSRAISDHDLTELDQAIKASVDSAHEYLDRQH
ncbi:Hpt domain-containing protein [Vibrio gigantis]|uniref:Hpt domain-containing protein n=1 Tax=Vibrio gigantis TaxID=296199 RepID=A0A5M9NU32_9VIBR|nr:Hpt domain-containing protein [Vibrio gigantis]KAA8674181.1 Hpt domain-containing protein [Vibrio gigantis]